MFDAVINHISRQSAWFQAFLAGQAPYTDYFIVVDPGTDVSDVVRPRATPLLTPVESGQGTRHVWTTFSADQIDLNYANPRVLLEMVDLLLFYVEHGADIIRLDAIAYLWKEIGTPCIHLPQTHRVVKLFRAVLDAVAPGVLLITETNVPHEENISYFGDPLPGTDETDEAQIVYQFPLAPLVLHAFRTGDARRLTEWAATLTTPSPAATFFNFIASHDGIGVMPARGLLDDDEIQALVERTLAHGGQVSYRANPDGSRSVYELNITLFDALNDPRAPQPELDVRLFLASQVIMLSLAGVPGIYVHSLFGSRNCHECVARTGRARSINREKFRRQTLDAELADPESLKSRVFRQYVELLRLRGAHAAFHPSGGQRVLRLRDAVFSLARTAPDGRETVLCLVNVSPDRQVVHVDLATLGLPLAAWRDIISGETYGVTGGRLSIPVAGYQALWLTPLVARSELRSAPE
jgi:sucrose phosphorylase